MAAAPGLLVPRDIGRLHCSRQAGTSGKNIAGVGPVGCTVGSTLPFIADKTQLGLKEAMHGSVGCTASHCFFVSALETRVLFLGPLLPGISRNPSFFFPFCLTSPTGGCILSELLVLMKCCIGQLFWGS